MIFEQTPSGKRDVIAFIKQEADGRTFTSEKPKSTINYVICMMPRTGSTMFCSLLEKTNLLGYPDEYLNPRGVVQMYAQQYVPGSLAEYADTLRRERATPNGVFGMKVTFDDWKPIADAQLVKELFGPIKFIYLDREDLILQAVSAVIAQQTGVWHRDAAGAPYRSQFTGEPSFDEAAIIAKIDEHTRMRANWERYFSIHMIKPLRLTYEQFLGNVDGAVKALAELVEVSIDAQFDASMATTTKLADERSDNWAQRIRDKYRARVE
jgi:LPS sulfotransferase NodH